MSAPEDKQKLLVSQAVDAAQEFSKVYYEASTKRRHALSKMYLEAANLVWNGNHVVGHSAIQKFYEALPVSTHNVESLDSQPISDHVTNGQTTILISASGTVTFEGQKPMCFHQQFILTSVDNTWKIVSDCLRTQ